MDRPFEGRVHVRLALCSREYLAAFDKRLIADPCVLKADQICGDLDYRLWVAHPTLAEVDIWLAALRAFEVTGECRYEPIRRKQGHELPGLLLHQEAWPSASSERNFDPPGGMGRN